MLNLHPLLLFSNNQQLEIGLLLLDLQVLGIKKSTKNEAETGKGFRPRSSSSQFYKHIFSEKSMAKNGKEDHSKDKIDDKEITTSAQHGKCYSHTHFISLL